MHSMKLVQCPYFALIWDFFCCLMYSVLDLRPSEVSLCMETAFLYLTGKEKCKYLNERKGKKEFVHVVLSSVNL